MLGLFFYQMYDEKTKYKAFLVGPDWYYLIVFLFLYYMLYFLETIHQHCVYHPLKVKYQVFLCIYGFDSQGVDHSYKTLEILFLQSLFILLCVGDTPVSIIKLFEKFFITLLFDLFFGLQYLIFFRKYQYQVFLLYLPFPRDVSLWEERDFLYFDF